MPYDCDAFTRETRQTKDSDQRETREILAKHKRWSYGVWPIMIRGYSDNLVQTNRLTNGPSYQFLKLLLQLKRHPKKKVNAETLKFGMLGK